MDFMAMLGALLEGGADTFQSSYNSMTRLQGDDRDRKLRETELGERARANKAQESEREAIRLQNAMRDINNREEGRRRARSTGKVARGALSTTERGRNILLSGAGELDDEGLGQPDFLRNLDDLMRAVQDPKPEVPREWKPTTMQEALDFDTEKAKIDARYRRPTGGGGGSAVPQASRVLTALNPQIDDTARDLKGFEDILGGMREEAGTANLLKGLGKPAPPSAYTPADTAGYGATKDRMRSLTATRDAATQSLLTGQPMAPTFSPTATNAPAAPAAQSSMPSWRVPGMHTASDQDLKGEYQKLYSDLIGLGMTPEQAKAESDKRFAPIIQTRRARP